MKNGRNSTSVLADVICWLDSATPQILGKVKTCHAITFQSTRIGWEYKLPLPPQSPDPITADFSLQSYIKDHIYICFLPYSLNEPRARSFATIATFKVKQFRHCLLNVKTLHRKFVKLECALRETSLNVIILFLWMYRALIILGNQLFKSTDHSGRAV
jgi:hypothetical protein